MIDKFNFYDIYGYFVPGAVLLAILWTPFGLVTKTWPSADWTSAIIVVVIAYVLGHIIQSIATFAIRLEIKDSTGKKRLPSSVFLDADNDELTDPVKTKIACFIKRQFCLDLDVNKIGNPQLDKVRKNAFFLARGILIQGKASSYAEQFEGMYALTSGLVAMLALGFFYWLGWAAAAFRCKPLVDIAILVVAASLLTVAVLSAALLRISDEAKYAIGPLYSGLLLVAFLAIGYLLALQFHPTPRQNILIAVLAAFALTACLRIYSAYMDFAKSFAATVWRDYLAYNVKPGNEDKTADNPEKKKANAETK